ncbi:hypothetical protein WA158_008342 [Blastocystis sp. Blastoise]
MDHAKNADSFLINNNNSNNEYLSDSCSDSSVEEEENNTISRDNFQTSELNNIKESMKQNKLLYPGYSSQIVLKSIIKHILLHSHTIKATNLNGLDEDDDTFIKIAMFKLIVKANLSSSELNEVVNTFRLIIKRFNKDITIPLNNPEDYMRHLHQEITRHFFMPTSLYICKKNVAIYGSSFQRNCNNNMRCVYCNEIHKNNDMERVLYSPLLPRIINMIKCNIYQKTCSVYSYDEVMKIINTHHLFNDYRLAGHFIYNGIPSDDDRKYYESNSKYVNDINLCYAMREYKNEIEKAKADIILFCGIFTDEFAVYNKSIFGSHSLLTSVGIRLLNLKDYKYSDAHFCIPITFCPSSFLQTIIQLLYQEFEVLINGYLLEYNNTMIKVQCLPLNFTFDYKGGSVIGGSSSSSNKFCNWCSITIERNLSNFHGGIQFLRNIIHKHYEVKKDVLKVYIREKGILIDTIPCSCLQTEYKCNPVNFYCESEYNNIRTPCNTSLNILKEYHSIPLLLSNHNNVSNQLCNKLSIQTNLCHPLKRNDKEKNVEKLKDDYTKKVLHLQEIDKQKLNGNVLSLYPSIKISRVYGINPDSLHLNLNLSKEYYSYLFNVISSSISNIGSKILAQENTRPIPISLSPENIGIIKTRLSNIHSFDYFPKNKFIDIINPTFFFNLNSKDKFVSFTKYLLPLMHDYTYNDSKLFIFLEELFSVLNNFMSNNIPYELNALLLFKKNIYLTLYKLECCMPKELISTQDHIIIHLFMSILYMCLPTFQYTYTNERFFGLSGMSCRTKRSPGQHILIKMMAREYVEYSLFSQNSKNNESQDNDIFDYYDINCGSYSLHDICNKPEPTREILLSIMYTLLTSNNNDFNKCINDKFFKSRQLSSANIWDTIMFDENKRNKILIWFKVIYEKEIECYRSIRYQNGTSFSTYTHNDIYDHDNSWMSFYLIRNGVPEIQICRCKYLYKYNNTILSIVDYYINAKLSHGKLYAFIEDSNYSLLDVFHTTEDYPNFLAITYGCINLETIIHMNMIVHEISSSYSKRNNSDPDFRQDNHSKSRKYKHDRYTTSITRERDIGCSDEYLTTTFSFVNSSYDFYYPYLQSVVNNIS